MAREFIQRFMIEVVWNLSVNVDVVVVLAPGALHHHIVWLHTHVYTEIWPTVCDPSSYRNWDFAIDFSFVLVLGTRANVSSDYCRCLFGKLSTTEKLCGLCDKTTRSDGLLCKGVQTLVIPPLRRDVVNSFNRYFNQPRAQSKEKLFRYLLMRTGNSDNNESI